MRACGPVLDRSLSTEVISPFLSLRASLLKIHFSFPSADGVSEIRGGKGGKESWKHHRNVTHEEARASLLVLDIHSYSNRTLSFCFVKTHSHVGGLCSLKKTFVLILFFFFFLTAELIQHLERVQYQRKKICGVYKIQHVGL